MASGGGRSGPTTSAADMAEAARIREGGGEGTFAGKRLPKAVEIDADATQKYVLIEVATQPPTYFVRGSARAAYHKDAAYSLVHELSNLGAPYKILGGGRIQHSVGDTYIKVYGFSYGFPWHGGVSKHDVAADLLRKEYPEYTVETSDEGY